MSKVFAVPVKYMVVKSLIGYKVIDTSFEGNGKTVSWKWNKQVAHVSAAFKNAFEGYQYRY